MISFSRKVSYMRKAVLIAIILPLIFVEHVVAQQRTATIQDKRQAAAKANIDLNRGLPTMLDSQTMLTKVEASASLTVYHIKMVNYPSDYLDHDFLINAQEIVGRRNCADRDIRWGFDQGIVMKYIVSGSDNKQAGSFIISSVYCQRYRRK